MSHRRPGRAAVFAVSFVVLVTLVSIGPAGAQLTVTHFAGSVGGLGSNDGVGPAARFNFDPTQFHTFPGVAIDGAGNVYVADSTNNTIRKITSSGVVMTLAGLAGLPGQFADGTGSAARFNNPGGIAVDASGNVYVADTLNNIIRKITPAGVVTTFAGAWSIYNSGSTDGTGSAARFTSPMGLAIDASGNLYVADYGNDIIRKITPGAVVTTLAGTASFVGGSADGTGSAAQFYRPTGVAVDAGGNVYVADWGNHTVRKITPTAVVTTLAGSAGQTGSVDGTGTAARFGNLQGVAVDGSGNVFATDSTSIRKITPGGLVTTFAGAASTVGGSADGLGAAAQFNDPAAIALDSSGNLYVSETGNHTIRMITPGAVVTTVAGTALAFGSTDGTGSAARFNWPNSVAVDSSGNVYVGDVLNKTVRKITAGGVVTTLAGSAGQSGKQDGTGSAARFANPAGLAVDSGGNVYVADSFNNNIRKITPTGVVTTFAGTGFQGYTNGTGTAASFYQPVGLAIDGSGNLYVAESGNSMIRKITASAVVTTLAGSPGGYGTADGTGSAAQFYQPTGVAVDASGTVYVADRSNHSIRMITSGGVVTTLAGTPGFSGGSDGTGSAAGFKYPYAVAVDSSGNLWVTDDSERIRKVAPGGVVTSVAGTYAAVGPTDGTGTAARLFEPKGIAIDANGSLYIADQYNQCIRKARPAIADAATIDAASGTTFQTRVLGTTPNTGSTWSWSLIRRPAGSSNGISSTAVQNPTFTPDAPDLYIFQVEASNSSGSRISTVSLMAAPFTGPFPSGDTNGDGAVNVKDVFYLVNYLFAGGAAPVGVADVNGDTRVDAADVVYLINYLYAGGTAPH